MSKFWFVAGPWLAILIPIAAVAFFMNAITLFQKDQDNDNVH